MDLKDRLDTDYYLMVDVSYPTSDMGLSKPERLAAIRAYNEAHNKKRKEFEFDLLEATGLEDHPNAKAIFQFAWDEGHSGGFREVYNFMQDLAELFFDKSGRLLVKP